MMNARPLAFGALVGATLAAAALAGPAIDAQSPSARPAATSDTSAALLAEVRALRSEIAAAVSASQRAQLLVARVQLQEQRIIYFDRRRAEVAVRVAAAAAQAAEVVSRMERL